MRRILLSTKGEFTYPKKNTNLRSFAVKKLAILYKGVESKTVDEETVVVSNTANHKQKA